MTIQQENSGITAIALAANTDFGRCKLASRIPPALWPIQDETAINRLLGKLTNLPISKFVICCNGNKTIFQQSMKNPEKAELLFIDEKMPFGTAGCIREAIKISSDDIIIAIPSQMVEAPDLSEAIKTHKDCKAVLSIVSGKNKNSKSYAQIFIANREISKYIPEKGYFDIKENLIPALVRNNKKIIAQTLPVNLYSFRNHNQYLEVMSEFLAENNLDVLISENAKVSATAKICGPAVIMDNSEIGDNAIIIGPAIIGRNVKVNEGSLIEQSILWDGTNINKECFINNCVTDYNTIVPAHSRIANKAVIRNKQALINLNYYPSAYIRKIAAVFVMATLFAWSYLPELKELIKTWLENDDYSAGILVPFLACAAIWFRKKIIFSTTNKSILAGLFIFFISQLIRFFGLYFMYSSAQRLSLIICLWSIVIILFGIKFFYMNFSIFLFSLLMLPPPRLIHNSIMLPLQQIATSGAAFCLGLFGYAVHRQGNILYINNSPVAVSEACNGLRMITAFLIITVFMSLIIKRSKWEKLSLLISSLPIALLCNIARLTLTALIFTIVWSQKWASLVHDFSGYAMVPLAIAMVLFEMWIINILAARSKMNIST
ncbi:MAG: archaeosortase/exosortase family protein [Phycisphaerales bacterium]